MAIILDTNALSAFVDGQVTLRRAIESEIELALPVIVIGEYLYGVRQSPTAHNMKIGSRLIYTPSSYLRSRGRLLPAMQSFDRNLKSLVGLFQVMTSGLRP